MGSVWLVDPVDWPDAIDRALTLGEPAGVIQLLDRHNRDCVALAERLGVPHVVVPDELPGSPFECVPVVRRKRWRETALWWPETRTLVVAEALGTNRFFTGGRAPLGVHLLRLSRPRLGGRAGHLDGHGRATAPAPPACRALREPPPLPGVLVASVLGRLTRVESTPGNRRSRWFGCSYVTRSPTTTPGGRLRRIRRECAGRHRRWRLPLVDDPNDVTVLHDFESRSDTRFVSGAARGGDARLRRHERADRLVHEPSALAGETAPASSPGRTSRGGATRPASFTGGLSGSRERLCAERRANALSGGRRRTASSAGAASDRPSGSAPPSAPGGSSCPYVGAGGARDRLVHERPAEVVDARARAPVASPRGRASPTTPGRS